VSAPEIEPGAWRGVSPSLAALALPIAAAAIAAGLAIARNQVETFVALSLAHAAFYAAAVWFVLRRPARRFDLLFVVLFAIALRIIAVAPPLNLSSDAYRYVWDGRVQAAGVNPYLYVPADERLAHLRDAAIYPNVNRKEEAPTVYPPVAQALFFGAVQVWDGIAGIRMAMLAMEALLAAALLAWLRAGQVPRTRVLIYAWHPLPLWEFASQGHVDAAAAALAVLAVALAARGAQTRAGLALAAATLVKFYPAVLAPALWRRGGWRLPLAFAACVALAYAPYAWSAGAKVAGFLGGLAASEGYSDGWGFHPVWLLRDLGLADPPAWAYIAAAGALLGGVALWSLVRRGSDDVRPSRLVLLAAAFVFLTSPHYPWYFAWLVPLLARSPNVAVLAMTLGCVVLYLPRTDGGWSWTHLYAVTYWAPFLLWAATARMGRLSCRR
jgi:hypothetical protein